MRIKQSLAMVLVSFLASFLAIFMFLSGGLPLQCRADVEEPPPYNGDVNESGNIDIGDAIYILQYLFKQGPAPPLADACCNDLEQRIAELEALVLEQQEILQHFSIEYRSDGQGNDNLRTILISDVNLQLVNGLGATNGKPWDPTDDIDPIANGLGNLIVGYQESRAIFPAGEDILDPEDNRTGSHNILVGVCHNYSSGAAVLVGALHTSEAPGASVLGGIENTASGTWSSVSGGWRNNAGGLGSSILGGSENTATGHRSAVSGGKNRSANGEYDWVAGTLLEDE